MGFGYLISPPGRGEVFGFNPLYLVYRMFRTSWKKVSYAKATSAGKDQLQQQQPLQQTGRGGGVGGRGERRGSGGGGGTGGHQRNDYVENARRTRDANIILRDERVSNAAREKFLFSQRLKMEEKRTRLAKGNILNFLMDRKSVDDKRVLLNKVLRTVGFKGSDFLSIKLNDYRDSQAEVLLKDGVTWNLEDIERKLKEAGLNVTVSRFDEKEEVVNIFGLPLTNNVEEMKEKIREAVEPFVTRVKEIIATVHNGEGGDESEDFFDGLYDGNYKVKIQPLKDALVQIPNFIVVDKDKKVCAKVVYSKSINEKKYMCTSCYETDHFRDNVLCKGPKTWDKYAEEFEVTWREALGRKSDEVEDSDMDNAETDSCRYSKIIKDLNTKLSQEESKVSELEVQIEDYKKLIEGGDGNGEENDSDTFVEARVGPDEEGNPVMETDEDDPLNVKSASASWAEQMAQDDQNHLKRTATSPPGGENSSKKNGAKDDVRKNFDDLNLEKGKLYDVTVEGGTTKGTLMEIEFPFVTIKSKGRNLKLNLRHKLARIRLATQGSI